MAVPLVSVAGNEYFFLTVSHETLGLMSSIPHPVLLAKLSLKGKAHVNPDGSLVQTPYLFIRGEADDDRWAVPAAQTALAGDGGLLSALDTFLRYANIIEPPLIQGGLFFE